MDIAPTTTKPAAAVSPARPLGEDSLRFTTHSLDRYVQRVRPGCDHTGVGRELRAMREIMTISPTPPAWLNPRSDQPAVHYLVLGDVVFLLLPRTAARADWIAITCLTTGPSPAAVTNNRARRRRVGAARRAPRAARAARVHRRERGWWFELVDDDMWSSPGFVDT